MSDEAEEPEARDMEGSILTWRHNGQPETISAHARDDGFEVQIGPEILVFSLSAAKDFLSTQLAVVERKLAEREGTDRNK
jgi:hypothetical protein